MEQPIRLVPAICMQAAAHVWWQRCDGHLRGQSLFAWPADALGCFCRLLDDPAAQEQGNDGLFQQPLQDLTDDLADHPSMLLAKHEHAALLQR